MAFALDQTWDESARVRAAAGRPDAPAPILPYVLDRQFRRAGATLLSAVVHILLIWMLLNKLAGNPGGSETAVAEQGGLLQFDLSAPASASAAAERQPVQPATPVVSEVDVSAASDLPPPEWTVSRLPLAAESELPAAADSLAGTSAAAGGTGAGTGAGKGGGDGYDPYAGAAPQWRETQERAGIRSPGGRVLGFVGLGQASTGGLVLDEAALEAIRLAVAGSLPGRRGTVELVVRVSPTGVVLQATPRSGSAPPDAKAALARALIGKRLYHGSASRAQTITLPAFSLG